MRGRRCILLLFLWFCGGWWWVWLGELGGEKEGWWVVFDVEDVRKSLGRLLGARIPCAPEHNGILPL